MTEDRKAAAVRRGHEAQAQLDSPVLQQAFIDYEKDLMIRWRMTAPEQSQAREELWRQINAIAAVHAKLQAYIRNGREAQRELDRLNEHNEAARKEYGGII